ncbi:hypothetical protein TIFTF001_005983 [Ficus carica]|uniref:Uncharacterized protein n=1 Tax=Ficus carica TaxID=3494 RepID=A0AA88D033_FICCA|nr:hypothetical protein TIFTF001_005983 [Ficus carica]
MEVAGVGGEENRERGEERKIRERKGKREKMGRRRRRPEAGAGGPEVGRRRQG